MIIIINANIFYILNITNKKYIKEECENNSILYLNSYGPMHDNFSFDNKKKYVYINLILKLYSSYYLSVVWKFWNK